MSSFRWLSKCVCVCVHVYLWRVVLIREFWKWPDLLHLPILPPGLSVLQFPLPFFLPFLFISLCFSHIVVLPFLMSLLVYVSSAFHAHKGQTQGGAQRGVFTTGMGPPLGFFFIFLFLYWAFYDIQLCFYLINTLCCFALYGKIFSLANVITISPDEAHLDHISFQATLCP